MSAASMRLPASFATMLPLSLTVLSPSTSSSMLTLILPLFRASRDAASSAASFVAAVKPSSVTVPLNACTALLTFVPLTSISVMPEIFVVPPAVRMPHTDSKGAAEIVSLAMRRSVPALMSSDLLLFWMAAASLTFAILPPVFTVRVRPVASILTSAFGAIAPRFVVVPFL